MAILIKNDEQIELMRKAGKIVAKTHELLEKAVKPGITTKELDEIAEDYIRSCGATPSFKGYNGFSASICTSVNDEVIHGIPSLRKLKDGDIISIDIGAYINGFHGDAARTHPVGNISEEAKKLIEITKQSFFEGLKFANTEHHLHDISAAVGDFAEANGFSVVVEYVGHGIGRAMHEDPQVPNYRVKKRGSKLIKGMTIALEPMINVGTYEVKVLKDNWTVVTKDAKLSAHYENTFAITDGEAEILTI